MRVEFKKSFLKDLKKLKDKQLKELIFDCIVQVEAAQHLGQIRNLKKLTGYDDYFIIRIGDYRIGLKIENEIVFFVVFEHRKDIYKEFP
jgi:mRNA interferase RelE/StbE